MLSLIMDDSALNGVESRVLNDRDRLQMLLIETHEKMLTLSQRNMNIQERQGKVCPVKPFYPREKMKCSTGPAWENLSRDCHNHKYHPRTVKYHIGNVVKSWV